MTKGVDPLFAAPAQPKSWADVIPELAGPHATEYVKAFQRSCPGVRLTDDEREELRRLFFVALGQRHL